MDTKLKLLTETVTGLLRDGFNPIVFCRFIDTPDCVAEHLAKRLSNGYGVAAVTGLLPPDEREARIRELTADPERRPVLVATDCLSEGVNLQDSFQAVVHYDLAWKLTRHEQREGRVVRFGQRAQTVRAVTIYGTDNGIDGIVLNVLLRKHEQIRRALGISVPVPDRSDDVVQAILEGLLLRDDPGRYLAFDAEYTAGNVWLLGIRVVRPEGDLCYSIWASPAGEAEALARLDAILHQFPALPAVTWNGVSVDVPALRKAAERV